MQFFFIYKKEAPIKGNKSFSRDINHSRKYFQRETLRRMNEFATFENRFFSVSVQVTYKGGNSILLILPHLSILGRKFISFRVDPFLKGFGANRKS